MLSMEGPDIEFLQSPLKHIRHVQGVTTLNVCHKKIIKAIRENDRVSIRACHGIGKTFTLAKVILWFLSSIPYSKVLTTAPTNRQVNHLLWSEIRKGHKNSILPLGGKILDTPYWKIEDEWYALGYSPEKGRANQKEGESNNSAFQGFHAENMLIVLDEATGIPPWIWDQVEGMATSGNVKIVAIGNPTTKNCRFYETFSSRIWHNVHLSVFDSPNLTANRIYDLDALRREMDHLLSIETGLMNSRISHYHMKNRALVTLKWVINRAMPGEWGIDSIPFRTRCLGEFPEVETDIFFPDELVASAVERVIEEAPQCRYYGLDPARFGSDNSVLTIIEGYRVIARIEMHGKDTMAQANRMAREITSRPRLADEKVIIDTTGVGAGVTDRIKEMQRDGLLPDSLVVFEFHNGNLPHEENDTEEKQSRDKGQFANKKAKALDLLSQDMNLISIPESESNIYKRELPTIVYDYDGKGRKRVESKDDYKARTGRPSPDNSESLAYANYGRYIIATKKRHQPRITAL